jgi:hypothetical protein
MSRRPRRNHTPAFKARVALAAIKGDRTLDRQPGPPHIAKAIPSLANTSAHWTCRWGQIIRHDGAGIYKCYLTDKSQCLLDRWARCQHVCSVRGLTCVQFFPH